MPLRRSFGSRGPRRRSGAAAVVFRLDVASRVQRDVAGGLGARIHVLVIPEVRRADQAPFMPRDKHLFLRVIEHRPHQGKSLTARNHDDRACSVVVRRLVRPRRQHPDADPQRHHVRQTVQEIRKCAQPLAVVHLVERHQIGEKAGYPFSPPAATSRRLPLRLRVHVVLFAAHEIEGCLKRFIAEEVVGLRDHRHGHGKVVVVQQARRQLALSIG